MPVLEVNDLRKSFKDVCAVDDISFSVEKGEIFTIIGPNGAGKTTTLEMIEGLLEPDRGFIRFGNLNWKEHGAQIRVKIGVQPQSGALFDLLTPRENLELFTSFYPDAKTAEDILSIVNLTAQQKKQLKKLSGGQRQRLAIGIAMISNPEIIFLDEPTTGLDPQARRNIWDIILQLKEAGKTTILTTHYMEEAEKLSDRVCIVDQGKIIAMDTPAELIRQLGEEREISLSIRDGKDEAKKTFHFIKNLPAVTMSEQKGEMIRFWCRNPEETLFKIFGFAKEQNYQVDQVAIHELSLEDVFIRYTGKEWRD